MGYHRKSRDSFRRRSEEPFMFRRNIHVEELLIIKIEKIVLLFLEYVKPFFCGILNAAQPDPRLDLQRAPR